MKSKDLVKTIDEMRELTRNVYINGYESKDKLSPKGTTMTDKDLARLKIWLAEFYKSADKNGNTHRIIIDSRNINHNPLFNVYKIKSYTNANNVEIHFQLLDFLSDGKQHSTTEIIENVSDKIKKSDCDVSILKNLLKHYVQIGLINEIKKDGRSKLYCLADDSVNLSSWEDAINFYSEVAPVGVIGSFLLDKREINSTDTFRFKHHYLLYALESHIVYDALDAIFYHKKIRIHFTDKSNEKNSIVLPIRLFVSTHRGSMHLLVHKYEDDSFEFIRLSKISHIDILEEIDLGWQIYEGRYCDYAPHMWGVHYRKNYKYDHVELVIHVENHERHIINRLEREKRNGSVEQVYENTYKYSTDTYDALEMFPWLRTFIGRIESFTCSNKKLEKRFWDEIEELKRMYSDG